MMKKLLKKMTAFASIFLLTSPLATNFAFAQNIDREVGVTIGFDNTFAPFGFEDESGDNVGFDIDLAKEIFARMDVTYEFQPIDWAMKETELNGGQIDMIWNGYSVTPERKEVVLFSDPYIQNRQIIIVKADSEVQSKADLAGKTIATQEQSASFEAIMEESDFADTLDGGQPVTYPTFVEVFSDLDNERVEAIVVDELLALYYLEQRGESDQYRTLDDNFGTEDYAVGFRKVDEEFVKEFNQILAELIEDGTFDEIKSEWFAGIDIPGEKSMIDPLDDTEDVQGKETSAE